MYGRARETVGRGFVEMSEAEGMDLVPLRQSLDQRQQQRNHFFRAAWMQPAGHDEGESH